MTSRLMWPNGKKVAVSVTVMFETWARGQGADLLGADHASQVRHRRPCRQGLVHLWRSGRRVADHQLFDRLGIPGTFFVNARCTEEYPDAVKQIVRSGHDIGGHAYTQDQLLAYMSLEEQEATIRQSIDLLQACGGKKVTGWASPVVAFTPETAGFLAKAGLTWTTDVTYVGSADQDPHRRTAPSPACRRRISPTTACCGPIRAISTTPTKAHSTIWCRTSRWGCIVLVIHCQFGGRPLITRS